MNRLRARLLLDAGVLRLQALQGELADGEVVDSSVLDGSEALAKSRADLRFVHIDLAHCVRPLQPDTASRGKTAHEPAPQTRTPAAALTALVDVGQVPARDPCAVPAVAAATSARAPR